MGIDSTRDGYASALGANSEFTHETVSFLLGPWALPDGRFRGHPSTLTHVHRIQFALSHLSVVKPTRLLDNLPALDNAVLNDAVPRTVGPGEGLSGMAAKACVLLGEVLRTA